MGLLKNHYWKASFSQAWFCSLLSSSNLCIVAYSVHTSILFSELGQSGIVVPNFPEKFIDFASPYWWNKWYNQHLTRYGEEIFLFKHKHFDKHWIHPKLTFLRSKTFRLLYSSHICLSRSGFKSITMRLFSWRWLLRWLVYTPDIYTQSRH